MPASQGQALNCFALIKRDNSLIFKTTTKSINSAFILEQLDQLSHRLSKETVVVLDNAKPHTAKLIQERRSIWQQRGLTIFYLPPYSPQLNIAEILWRKLKYEWLEPQDYLSFPHLSYSVHLALAAVGSILTINFARSGLEML